MSLHPIAEFYRSVRDVKSEYVADRLVLLTDPKQAREIANTGHEAMQCLFSNLSAIGTLIASIDHEDKGYDPNNLNDVGSALISLSDLGFAMAHDLHNLEFTLQGGKL